MVRIPDILRAASLLDRRTPTEIAVATGIKQSRVARLLTGRTAPRPDEPARILAACGCDPAAVTTPATSRAGGLPARTVLGLLLSNHTDHREVRGDVSASLCVDKLSCSFDAETEALLAIARLGRLVEPKQTVYRKSYQLGHVFVQHGPRAAKHLDKRRSSRVEFNPARASDLDWKLVRRVLDLGDDLRVTRLDVAVDIPISVARFQVLADKHKARPWRGPGGIETIYVGPREHQVRVYDRRAKLIQDKLAWQDHPELTRVEAQLRNLGCGLAELLDLADPFARFAFVDLAGKLDGLHVLGASYAATFGVQALRDLGVAPADVRAIVRDTPTNEPAHPSRVFADQWPAVVAELLRRLGVSS